MIITVSQRIKRGKRTAQTVADFPCPKCQKTLQQVEFAGYDYKFGFYCDNCENELQPEDAREYAFDYMNRYTDNY